MRLQVGGGSFAAETSCASFFGGLFVERQVFNATMPMLHFLLVCLLGFLATARALPPPALDVPATHNTSLHSHSSGGCLNPGGNPCACSGIPSTPLHPHSSISFDAFAGDNQYYLTSFDDQNCACVSPCSARGPLFLADKQRFGCGARLSCVQNCSC